MSDSLFALPVKQTLSPSLTLRQQYQLPLVVVEHPQVRAAVTLQGAHLVAWRPAGEKPVLVERKKRFSGRCSHPRGRTDLLALVRQGRAPNHGFARILPWELSDHSEDDKQVQLTFTLRDSTTLTEPFPPPPPRSRLKPSLPLSRPAASNWWPRASIRQRPRCIATSPWGPSAIFTSAVSATALSMKVNGGRPAQQQGDLTFSGEWDRVYTAPAETSLIHDPVLGRVIEVHHQHHSDVVAWNCGQSLSQSIGDFTDDSYLSYVCVETARVNDPLVSTATTPARLR